MAVLQNPKKQYKKMIPKSKILLTVTYLAKFRSGSDRRMLNCISDCIFILKDAFGCTFFKAEIEATRIVLTFKLTSHGRDNPSQDGDIVSVIVNANQETEVV